MGSERVSRVTGRVCDICGECRGTIAVSDGMVCEGCMPADLLESAASVGVARVRLYRRAHPNGRSCAGMITRRPEGAPDGDRSMGLTGYDGITLADRLCRDIDAADSMDMVVSFIKMSGLNLIIDSLRELVKRGSLRVITTAYMGATEYEAIHEIISLPNTELRMELNAERSRLHAKSFIMNRSDGRGVAYVGSANLSKSALTSGEEWVVRIRQEDLPQVMGDLIRGYEGLWSSIHVKRITIDSRAEIEAALDHRGM